MDHLRVPEACQPQALSVPYLGFAPKYDRLEFDEFPERHGQDSDKLINLHNLNPWRKEWVESFFQEWLWFGVMSEFARACDINLDLDTFVRDDPSGSGRIITTAFLLSQLPKSPQTKFDLAAGLAGGSNCVRRISQESAQAVETAAKKRIWATTRLPTGKRINLAETLKSAQRVLKAIAERHSPLVRFEIVLSIEILCESVVQIVEARFGESIELQKVRSFHRFEAAMIARNWCPSRITSVVTEASTALNYIASLLPSYESEPHRSCRPRKCLKGTSTSKGISPLHRVTCPGDCPDVEVEETQTIQMWKSGGIPGLRPQPGVNLDQLEIIDCTRQRFVAISHVWAHGMGNSSKNALPTCQVKFLCNLVRQIAGDDAGLWVDSLSVPIDPETKRIAILKLRKVYEEACKVLVIDKDLMKVGSDQTVQILQLLCSEWQRRLWTLQEGRLARDLYIQFKDSAVSISALMATHPRSVFGATEFDYTLGAKLDLQHRFLKRPKDYIFFLNLVEDLAPRSVTHSSDEPICLAILLGLDLSEFHPYPKMADIYRSFPSIPQDLMFINQPRLADRGLTWAPSTFLEVEFVQFPYGPATLPGNLSVEGLHVVKDCLLLHQDLIFQRVAGNGVYIIETTSGESYAIESQDFVSPDGRSSVMQLNRVIPKPAVIWEKTRDLFNTVSKAVLVSEIHEKNGISYCKFEMRLNGWRVGERYRDSHQFHLNLSGGVVGHIPADFVNQNSLCVG